MTSGQFKALYGKILTIADKLEQAIDTMERDEENKTSSGEQVTWEPERKLLGYALKDVLATAKRFGFDD